MNKEELRNKFLQLFIIGYEGINPSADYIQLIQDGLGGTIFFAENIKNRSEFKQTVYTLKNNAQIPLFLSIDQEGGLVERTIFADKKIEYLTPKALSRLSYEDVKLHYSILAQELSDMGLNFNFAPVVDVNTNPNNPIIGVRSFGDNSNVVNKFSKAVIDAFEENNIISCAKHFAGHGDTNMDSHLAMPYINSDYMGFYKEHLNCFDGAIKYGVDSIMVSHVHFSFFNELPLPASLSKNVVEVFLKKLMKFKGLIVSDDMVMGGVSKQYGLKESILMAINAGIEVLIFKNLSSELLFAIDEVVNIAILDLELQEKILNNYKKIKNFKEMKIKNNKSSNFDIEKNQAVINKLAEKTILINKNYDFLPITNNKNITICMFDNKEIFNLKHIDYNFKETLKKYNIHEIFYPLNPSDDFINKTINTINPEDVLIFLSYNAHINKQQVELFNKINADEKFLISCGLDDDIKFFDEAKCIISICCAKDFSIKDALKILIQN